MDLHIHTPTSSAQRWIKQVIYYRGYTAPAKTERLLPDGSQQLVIPLDERPRAMKLAGAETMRSIKRGWFMGLQTQPIDYEGEQNATTVCIQFQPNALSMLFGIPTQELTDAIIDIDDWQESLNDLIDSLLINRHAPQQLFSSIESFVFNRLHRETVNYHFTNYVVQSLAQGELSIAEISRRSGYTHKQLLARFRHAFGVTPKRLQRLLRLQQALTVMNSQGLDDFKRTMNSYYDDAHFINDFKAHTGFTPTQYLQNNRIYPHVVSLP